jgi:hypothetical protein
MRDERCDILTPFSERRNFDRKDAYAVEQILAKPTLVDLLL